MSVTTGPRVRFFWGRMVELAAFCLGRWARYDLTGKVFLPVDERHGASVVEPWHKSIKNTVAWRGVPNAAMVPATLTAKIIKGLWSLARGRRSKRKPIFDEIVILPDLQTAAEKTAISMIHRHEEFPKGRLARVLYTFPRDPRDRSA